LLLNELLLGKERIRNEFDFAEKMHQKAVEIALQRKKSSKKDASVFCNYAVFLKNHKKDIAGAEKYFKLGASCNPSHANCNGNYGTFLLSRGQLVEAESFLGRAARSSEGKKKKKDAIHWMRLYGKFLLKNRAELSRATQMSRYSLFSKKSHAVTYAVSLLHNSRELKNRGLYYLEKASR
jgi:predicted Zn-dependent protease